MLDDGKMSFFPTGPSNIYLPYLNILNQATLRIGKQITLCHFCGNKTESTAAIALTDMFTITILRLHIKQVMFTMFSLTC